MKDWPFNQRLFNSAFGGSEMGDMTVNLAGDLADRFRKYCNENNVTPADAIKQMLDEYEGEANEENNPAGSPQQGYDSRN